MSRRCLLPRLLVLLLVGCVNDHPIIPLPGPVAQRQRFTDLQAQGDFAAIAKTRVDAACLPGGSGSDACPALFAIHGRACLEMARQEAGAGNACPGPTDTAKAMLECSIHDLGAAEASGKLDASALGGVRQNHAEALYCRATMLPAAAGGPMVAQAESELANAPNEAKTKELAARVALYVAARSDFPQAQRCEAVERASAAAKAGLALRPDAATAKDLAGLANSAEDWRKRLSNCREEG